MERFPEEVQELVKQLKSAGMAIDENNPQQILQVRLPPQKARILYIGHDPSKGLIFEGVSFPQCVCSQGFAVSFPSRFTEKIRKQWYFKRS